MAKIAPQFHDLIQLDLAVLEEGRNRFLANWPMISQEVTASGGSQVSHIPTGCATRCTIKRSGSQPSFVLLCFLEESESSICSSASKRCDQESFRSRFVGHCLLADISLRNPWDIEQEMEGHRGQINQRVIASDQSTIQDVKQNTKLT